MHISRCAASLLALALLSTLPAQAADHELDVAGFPDVVRKPVELWSDGTRLAGDIFYPKGLEDGERLPALVLCHGWGGTKAHLNQGIAPGFADAGYIVLAFDYRGWGESDSRLVMRDEMPVPDADGFVEVRAQAIRELVDPLDQQEDIDAAISFMEGESHADPSRIGIWGSSFGGGHVIWRAGHDSRVKAVVAQVGSMNSRSGLARSQGTAVIHAQKVARARGEIEPVPAGAAPEGLTGSPYNDRFLDFVPVAYTDNITAPVLIIDAQKEHYFNIQEHGYRVYQNLIGRVPVEYHAWDMGHYDVYSGEYLALAMKTEIDFLNREVRASRFKSFRGRSGPIMTMVLDAPTRSASQLKKLSGRFEILASDEKRVDLGLLVDRGASFRTSFV